MGRFLRRLFGRNDGAENTHSGDQNRSGRGIRDTGGNSDTYFELLGQLQAAMSERKYEVAARLTRKSLRVLPSFVQETRLEFGSFDIPSIPALQQGGTAMALQGDLDGLRKMLEVVESNHDLRRWIPTVEAHNEDSKLFTSILEAVAENPSCLQKDVKRLVGVEDGHRVANLISWLEKAGKIARRKKGNTYSLVIAGSGYDTPLPPKRTVGSHRTSQRSPTCREINIESLPYVPLPRTPNRWEMSRDQRPMSRRHMIGSRSVTLKNGSWL